jgi:hypothetical protein
MIFFIPCGCFAVSNAQRYYHLNPKNNIMEAVIGLDFSSSFFTSSKHTSRLSSTVSDSKFPVAQPDRFEPLIFSFFLCQCHVVDKRSRSICVFFMLSWFIYIKYKKNHPLCDGWSYFTWNIAIVGLYKPQNWFLLNRFWLYSVEIFPSARCLCNHFTMDVHLRWKLHWIHRSYHWLIIYQH